MEQVTLSVLIPQTLDEKLKLAQVFAQSGLMPAGLKTPAQLLVALQMGHELGIPPMRAIQNIAVINGKPTLSADLMLAVAIKTGEVELIDTNNVTEDRAIVRLKRRGFPEHVSPFSIEDAKKAGLLSRVPWQQYPKRMLKARALAFAVRDMFPDVLAGLYTPDEIGGEEGRFDLPAGALNGLPESVSPVSPEKEIDPAGNDRLRPLWQAVHDRCKAIGVPCVELLRQVDSQAGSVREWMKSAWEQRNFSGLAAFDEVLKRFQAAPPPVQPAPAIDPPVPPITDLPNGGGRSVTPKKPVAEWSAERGPSNPFGLTFKAAKVWAAIEKSGKSSFLPTEIPFSGRAGNIAGQFSLVRDELERARLVRKADDGQSFLIVGGPLPASQQAPDQVQILPPPPALQQPRLAQVSHPLPPGVLVLPSDPAEDTFEDPQDPQDEEDDGPPFDE